jgi:hypothetical protein
MAKKKYKWLIMPQLHSGYKEIKVEEALLNKTREFLTDEEGDVPQFIILSGNFFDVQGFAYSAVRNWRGAIKPGEDTKKQPVLEATFASLSVYLSSLLSFQQDFFFAFDEIKQILMDAERPDLSAIFEEKIPFVSLPPQEMFGLRNSPISPYYLITQDDTLTLGELYPSVYLTKIISSIKSRFFCYFSHEGYTAFGFFDSLPPIENFGFETEPKPLRAGVEPDAMVKYVKGSKNLKEIFVALITAHNNAFLEQYLIPDYETLLNKLLKEEED